MCNKQYQVSREIDYVQIVILNMRFPFVLHKMRLLIMFSNDTTIKTKETKLKYFWFSISANINIHKYILYNYLIYFRACLNFHD